MKKNVALPTSIPEHTHTGVSHAAQLTLLGFRTFLFDFDLTVVNQHCYKNDITPQDVTDMSDSMFYSYFNNAAYIASLLSTLITTPDNAVAIVSFGREDVIKAFLSRLLDGEDGRHSEQIHIYTPLSRGRVTYSPKYKTPDNKNAFIATILDRRSHAKTLLIDDDKDMLSAAKMHFRQIHTCHVPAHLGTSGISPTHIESFLEECLEPPLSPQRQTSEDASSHSAGTSTPPSTLRSDIKMK